MAIGVGMIRRGEVGLVSKPLEAAIIMMVILTTFLAPPLLRFAFPQGATA